MFTFEGSLPLLCKVFHPPRHSPLAHSRKESQNERFLGSALLDRRNEEKKDGANFQRQRGEPARFHMLSLSLFVLHPHPSSPSRAHRQSHHSPVKRSASPCKEVTLRCEEGKLIPERHLVRTAVDARKLAPEYTSPMKPTRL